MKDWTTAKLLDVAKLILGVALFMSPWAVDAAAGPASVNAWIVGFAIAALAIDAIAAFARWEEWLNLGLGIWCVVAPWVLGFASGTATAIHVVVGVLVAVLAAIELRLMHLRSSGRTAAN